MDSNEWLHEAFSGFTLEKRAPADLVELCTRDLEVTLPPDYLEFFTFANGAEGNSPGQQYMRLWPIDELEELNLQYEAAESVPGMLLIGSNGGGEAYAIDFQQPPPAYVMLPFIGMSREDAWFFGNTFKEFMEHEVT
ncbi:MAG: SMI1/KNR4 family protein [Fimbriimonas sp.]